MKLYYSPGACSLADHIALLEAGVHFELEAVDLKRKVTASGQDFTAVNSKGYVPALLLDGGQIITENVAVLDWIATRSPSLGLAGELGRTRLLEALAFISSEIHKSFKPYFAGGTESEKAQAGMLITRRLNWLADRKVGQYLFGGQPCVADFYLFVMLRWAAHNGIAIPAVLSALHDRMMARPHVQAAIEFEEAPRHARRM